MRCYFLLPLITADFLDQWFGPQSFNQHVAGSTPGSVTFPSVGLDLSSYTRGVTDGVCDVTAAALPFPRRGCR